MSIQVNLVCFGKVNIAAVIDSGSKLLLESITIQLKKILCKITNCSKFFETSFERT